MITLAEAKLHLRLIPSLDDAESYIAEDALIEALIDAAYEHAYQITRVRFRPTSETLVLDGFPPGSQAILLPCTPVAGIESLDYVDPEGVDQSLDVETLRLDTRPLYPVLSPQWGSEWPAAISEPESVTITATVGHATTPRDVRAALLLLVGHYYEHREAVVAGVTVAELPLAVQALLAPHKIHAVG